jgi:hypothetical protein
MKSNRRILIGIFIIYSLVGSAYLLRAQAAATGVQGGAVSQGVNSLSDLQVMLQAVEMTPTVSADSMPSFGTFYSAQHAPGTRFAWPPLPGNVRQLPVWNLGDGVYLLNDEQVDYSQPLLSSRMAGGVMMDGMEPPGGGGGGYEYTFTPPVYTTNDLWLQMISMTNGTASLVINTPWNVTNGVYDLFATTNLALSAWQWLGRCSPGQTNLTVNGLADPQGFFILGLTNDTDGDGLTDAYERLVSHTNPNLYSTDGTGMSDGWEILYFGHTGIDPNADPDGDGLSNYQEFQMYSGGYNPTAWDSNTNLVGDAYEDFSGDGLANFMEAFFGGNMLTSNPAWETDTDGDGMPDLYKTMIGISTNSAAPAPGLPAFGKNPIP